MIKRSTIFQSQIDACRGNELTNFDEETALLQFAEFISSASYELMKLRSTEIEYYGE